MPGSLFLVLRSPHQYGGTIVQVQESYLDPGVLSRYPLQMAKGKPCVLLGTWYVLRYDLSGKMYR